MNVGIDKNWMHQEDLESLREKKWNILRNSSFMMRKVGNLQQVYLPSLNTSNG